MDWIWTALSVLAIIVIPAAAAELLFGDADREAHRRAAAAEAARASHARDLRNEEYGKEVLGRLAGNNPRAAALYQSYTEGLERRDKAEEQS